MMYTLKMYTVYHRQMSCATWLTLCTASTSVNHYLMLVFAGHCNFYSWQPSVSSLIQAVVLQRCQAVALLKPVSNWNLRNNPQIILNQNRKIQSFWSFLGKKSIWKSCLRNSSHVIRTWYIEKHIRYGKLNFWSMCLKIDVSYMFYSSRPIFFSPNWKFTRTDKH